MSNVSAIVMEEVTPSATAQHTLLAPEEVQVREREREGGGRVGEREGEREGGRVVSVMREASSSVAAGTEPCSGQGRQ